MLPAHPKTSANFAPISLKFFKTINDHQGFLHSIKLCCPIWYLLATQGYLSLNVNEFEVKNFRSSVALDAFQVLSSHIRLKAIISNWTADIGYFHHCIKL